jgi:hypothetical protein
MTDITIADFRLDVRFPGRAGDLQGQGAVAALIRELGDNYPQYHDFLASELTKVGGRPKPADYRGDLDGYATTSSRVQQIMIAEAVLRRCRGARQLGRPLNAPPDGTPYVDEAQRLVSADGRPSQEPQLVDPRAWKPPVADTG